MMKEINNYIFSDASYIEKGEHYNKESAGYACIHVNTKTHEIFFKSGTLNIKKLYERGSSGAEVVSARKGMDNALQKMPSKDKAIIYADCYGIRDALTKPKTVRHQMYFANRHFNYKKRIFFNHVNSKGYYLNPKNALHNWCDKTSRFRAKSHSTKEAFDPLDYLYIFENLIKNPKIKDKHDKKLLATIKENLIKSS